MAHSREKPDSFIYGYPWSNDEVPIILSGDACDAKPRKGSGSGLVELLPCNSKVLLLPFDAR